MFPWVIADYTSPQLDLSDASTYRDLSKPVGALNAARLRTFRTRMEGLSLGAGDIPPFLYGRCVVWEAPTQPCLPIRCSTRTPEP